MSFRSEIFYEEKINMKLKIGYAATGQLSFPGPKQQEMEKAIAALKVHAENMGFELIACDRLLITPDDATQARAYFESQGIDFLMINTVSFSAGALIPILARTAGAKIGLWGIPEGASTGVVPLNSFCGVNMYGSIIKNYLRDYGVKYKWFFGAGDDAQFVRRLSVTVKALRAIKKLKSSRVALIGGIAPGFNDLYFDERRINSLLDGIFVNRLHEFDEIASIADGIADAEAAPVAEKIAAGRKIHEKSAGLILLTAKLYLAYQKFIAENGYDAIAISCWPKFQDRYRYSVCSVLAMLNDEKLVAACEGDLPSAISMLALQEISGESTMLMDLSAYDESDDTVLMWHCGPASAKFCRKNDYTIGVNYHGLPHDGKEINCCGVTRDMEFDPERITVFRFSQDFTRTFALEGCFLGREKASFLGSRGWLGSLKLNGEAISARDLVNTILTSGFEHHYPIAVGEYGDVIQEMTAWLGLDRIEKREYRDYLQI